MAREWSNFFDPGKAKGPDTGPDVGDFDSDTHRNIADDLAGGDGPVTVSDLLARIKQALARSFPKRLAVVGEISNLSCPSSGHLYFTLKDSACALKCVMWRSSARRLKFQPSDGMEVVVEGRLDVYESRGDVQLYAEKITPKGQGALELAFRQLCEKLQKEGLFDPAGRKPIVRFPRAIGIVTSPTGAAIRDICRTLRRRWPGMTAYLVPARVQGDAAAGEIARAIALLDSAAARLGIDTLLVCRGGGSIEDLWPFNEEVVARAIHAANTPVISGVGHEVDTTIADLVADARAATPTAAAELAVPTQPDVRAAIEHLFARLAGQVWDGHLRAHDRLKAALRSVVFRDPLWRIRPGAQRVDELAHRLHAGASGRISQGHRSLEPLSRRLAAMPPSRVLERRAAQVDRLLSRLRWALGGRSKRAGDRLGVVQQRLAGVRPDGLVRLARQRVRAAARQLEAMSYRSILKRGFTVTRNADGAVLRSADQATRAGSLETEFPDGRVSSTVDGATGRPDPARPTPSRKRTRRKPKPDEDKPTLFD